MKVHLFAKSTEITIRNKALFGLCILLCVLNVFLVNHIFFAILAVTGVFLGVSQFLMDKKEKDQSLNACREDIPIWRQVVEFACILGFTIVIQNMGFSNVFDESFLVYFIIIFVGVIFGAVYQNFFLSIRSYQEGIKMPGRNNDMIPWAEIKNLSIEKEDIEIETNGMKHEMMIDRRDRKEFLSIVDHWQNRRKEEIVA